MPLILSAPVECPGIETGRGRRRRRRPLAGIADRRAGRIAGHERKIAGDAIRKIRDTAGKRGHDPFLWKRDRVPVFQNVSQDFPSLQSRGSMRWRFT